MIRHFDLFVEPQLTALLNDVRTNQVTHACPPRISVEKQIIRKLPTKFHKIENIRTRELAFAVFFMKNTGTNVGILAATLDMKLRIFFLQMLCIG